MACAQILRSFTRVRHLTESKYKAFLSYSHRDGRWAAWLHRALETYRIPKELVGQSSALGVVPKRLSPVFRDREELPSATDLGATLLEALAESATQIVICSPYAARSHWVNEEILSFKRLGREQRIFCIIVDGEPNATDTARPGRECFPHALRFRMGADGQLTGERTEPIAADARPGKDGKNNALLKLIAGLLGVGFDSLRRRDLVRRHRRLALVATSAFGGMLVTTGLAGMAWIARQNAERERLRAEAETEVARQTTAFLVDLFRVSDPGEARGNSITAREMLDKGATRIESELANQPAVQATLMDTVGTVYMRLGLYGQAKPLLERALERRRSLLDPRDADVLTSLNNVAELQRLRAQFEQSEKTYRQALLAAGGDRAPVTPQIAQTLSGLAEALSGQGRFDEAERALRKALAMQKKLYGAVHPTVANTLENLALAIFDRGDLRAALPLMESALAMQRTLHGDQPHPDFAEALNNLMSLEHASGNYARAEELLSQSIQMKIKLLGDKHPEIALGLNNLAFMAQDRRDYGRAEALYHRALNMQEELLGHVHPDVAQTLTNLASLLYDKGDSAGALRYARESLDILRELFPGDHPTVAGGLDQIGYWLLLQNDLGNAAASLDEALAMRLRLFGADHVQVAASRVHLAMLQIARHRYDDALASARESGRVFSANLPPGQWRIEVARSAEGAALAGRGDYRDAEALLLESYTRLNRDAAAWPIYKRQAANYLHDLYVHLRRPDEARRYAALTRLPQMTTLE